ncbi:hypothetical protein [Brevibacillus brevis]|uniref:hypothetical protein n=1 Tax=Brevibacillus brevis TaxID=1393 RepID=UPI0007D899AC|nr:hypothetical protein [Brevibacillus brevis]
MIKRNIKTPSYIVYDWEEQLVIQTDDYDVALKAYEERKKDCEEFFDRNGEFCEGVKVVLTAVLKNFYSAPTEKQNENGGNYWGFYEDTHETKSAITAVNLDFTKPIEQVVTTKAGEAFIPYNKFANISKSNSLK